MGPCGSRGATGSPRSHRRQAGGNSLGHQSPLWGWGQAEAGLGQDISPCAGVGAGVPWQRWAGLWRPGEQPCCRGLERGPGTQAARGEALRGLDRSSGGWWSPQGPAEELFHRRAQQTPIWRKSRENLCFPFWICSQPHVSQNGVKPDVGIASQKLLFL